MVHVVADQPLRGHALRPFLGLGRPLLAQHVDGLLQIAARLLERLLAVHHAGARAGAQLRHELCRNLFHNRHCLLLMKTPPSRR